MTPMGIMQLLNIFLFWLFFGLLASRFAKKRGRDPLRWFFVGFFLQILGVLAVFIFPKVQNKQPHHKPLAPAFSKRSDSWIKMWYYLDPSHAQQGPLEFPDLIKTWNEKGINNNSYIWGEGMQDWKQLSDLPDLQREIEQGDRPLSIN